MMRLRSKELKDSQRSKFFNNRILNKSRQFRYWKLNWRSGLIRLLERLLIGVNISDRLGGDLTQFKSSSEFYSQVIESRLVSEASILETIRIQSLGCEQYVELDGINKARRILKLASAKVDSFTGLVTTEAGLVIDSILPQWQKLIYMGGMLDAYGTSRKKLKEISGQWAVLPYSEYFFHTLTEEIASLLAIRNEFPEVRVITHVDTPQWALDLLHELNFEYQRVNHRAILVDELLCATSVGSFSARELALFSSAVEHLESQLGNKIFLSRSKLSRNDEELEQEILKVLLPEGFVIVIPDELPIHEQIKVIRAASVIVSFHGGALSHLVWCNKGTKVLEIFNHPYRSYDFARIAFEGQLNYSSLDSAYFGFNAEIMRHFLLR
jgi:hypothetical protein